MKTPTRQKVRKTCLLIFFLIFPMTMNYYSPYLSTTGVAKGILSGSFLFWAIYMVAALFLGRAGCGWICPLAGLQEPWEWAAHKPLKKIRFLHWFKYLVWGLWIAGIAFGFTQHTGTFKVEPFYLTENVVSWDSLRGNFIYYAMFGLVLLFTVPLGKRGFCKYGCFFAPMNMLGTKIRNSFGIRPSLQLKASPDDCNECGRCDKACTMSLNVTEMAKSGDMTEIECILCGECVDTCPKKALRFSWHR